MDQEAGAMLVPSRMDADGSIACSCCECYPHRESSQGSDPSGRHGRDAVSEHFPIVARGFGEKKANGSAAENEADRGGKFLGATLFPSPPLVMWRCGEV